MSPSTYQPPGAGFQPAAVKEVRLSKSDHDSHPTRPDITAIRQREDLTFRWRLDRSSKHRPCNQAAVTWTSRLTYRGHQTRVCLSRINIMSLPTCLAQRTINHRRGARTRTVCCRGRVSGASTSTVLEPRCATEHILRMCLRYYLHS